MRSNSAHILNRLSDQAINVFTSLAGVKPSRINWDHYVEAASHIHKSFFIPDTSYSPVMTRFLFGIGCTIRAKRIVVAGSYVGYGAAWLGIGSSISRGESVEVFGYDTNTVANGIAERNFATLRQWCAANFYTADARELRRSEPMDILLLDVDDPRSGKAIYSDLAMLAIDSTTTTTYILAHDDCVPRFERDLNQFRHRLSQISSVSGPYRFGIDDCGMNVSIIKK